MNIKKKMPKFISLLLSFAMTFSNVIPAYAMEITNSDSESVIDGKNIGAEESNFEDIKVTYKQSSSFFVTIPKTIALDGWKQSTYTVKVSGDIAAEQCVYVAPVDGISSTEDIDFYMEDQASKNKKANVVATVTQNKQHWSSAEATDGYVQTDNLINAPDLTAGKWKGIFQMEIKLESHVTHTHNYVEAVTKEPTCTEKGERTFSCDCGDSYTEEIAAKGHHYENGECTDCGEKDPSHTHSYTETITKEPTCTEKGEKTYICDCGDSYTEEMPAKGHNYENHICTECGEVDPEHVHSYDEGVITKEPTCTEKGEKTFTCSGCGHSYIEEIDATGHDYVYRNNWENTSNGGYAFIQEGTKWTSNNKGVNSSTATSTWTINTDIDVEYSFKYKVSSESNYDKLTITLDSTTIANAISGAGEEITYTATLTAGTHTLTATYVKDGSQNKNDDCGYVILEDLSNEFVEITKVPTCTEKGEKTFTCIRCGMTYSEPIDATGHNYENNKCTNCGEVDPSHVHTYEPYELIIEPQLVSSTKGTYPTNTAKYDKWKVSSPKEGYSNFYVNSICTGGSTGSQFNAKVEIALPDDYEGEYNYKYYFTGTLGCRDTGSAMRLYLNGNLIHRYSYGQVVSAIGSQNTISTIPLHAGKNTITLQANFYNASGSSNPDPNRYNWYNVYLENITLFDGSEYHICNGCGKKEIHYYNSTVTKEATCVEEGEMTYTCTECGYSYTETIATNGGHHYDENDVCVDCGHTHNYEPYKFTVEPKLISSTKGAYPTNTAKYDIWEIRGSKEGYSDFYVNSICTGGSTGSQYNATAEIVLPDDYEGEYNYQYYFTGTLGCNDMGAAMRLYLNNSLIHRYSYGQVDSAIGSQNTISTIPLHAGKNTVTLQANFYNASGSSNPNPDRYNWYDVYLENFSLFDGSEYHICNECGKKDEHHYVNGICAQCGWEEGNHEHHYVNGFCDQCGKDETQYNLIIDGSSFLNTVDGLTSTTQHIRNGDVIELPEKSNDAYNFEGYSIVRAVENVQLCSQNVSGGHYAICTRTGGPGRFVNYTSPTYEYEFGIKTEWIDTPENGGDYQSELSDYFWKQTAESDIITIERPMIYALTANEDITCSNIYSADCCSSGSMKIEDITRNKTYGLISTFSSSEPDGNVKILSTSSHTDSSTSSATRADKYTRKFNIYLQPGQYRLSASGQSGDGSGFGANSHYWLTIGSPLSASETLAAPVINGVHHTASGGTLYELIPIENGQEFNISTMYSVEGNRNIYLISNWSAKETE